MKNYRNIFIILIVLVFLIISCAEEDNEVIIEDTALRTCVLDALAKDKKIKLYTTDVFKITRLVCAGNIKNVKGIKNLKNLKELQINCSEAKEEGLKELSKLKKLNLLLLFKYHDKLDFINDFTSLGRLSLLFSNGLDLSPLRNNNVIKGLELFYKPEAIPPEVLDIIGSISSLEELYLSNNKLKNLNFLKNLKNLIGLRVDNNEIDDISGLSELRNLKIVNLENNKVKNIEALSNLNLNKINIMNNEIEDISPLKNSTQMTAIYAEGNKIKNIDVLRNMPYLEVLDLPYNDVANLYPLENLTKLSYLNLYFNRHAQPGDALRKLLNLNKLYISYTSINTFDFLENLNNINVISFEGCGIKTLKGFEKAKYINEVDFSGNNIRDLTGIENFSPQLYYIDLSYNKISDLSPMSNISSEHFWETINLSSNYIKEVDALSHLRIVNLYLYENCIKDFSPVNNKENINTSFNDINYEEQRVKCVIPDDYNID